jgi:hypothetical protein
MATLGACATHTAPPPQPLPSRAIGRSPEPQSEQRSYGVRGVTWREYYAEVAERARKRGMLVIWVNPPSVQ